MKSRRWVAALATLTVTAVVGAGLVAASPTASADVPTGTAIKIASQTVGGQRSCLFLTGELGACGQHGAPPLKLVPMTCWTTKLLCYQIRPYHNDDYCLYYDTELLGRVSYSQVCTSTTLKQRWRIDELDSTGRIRIRPASHTSRCIVYDPAELADDHWTVTAVEECDSRPASHTWFRILPY